MTVLKECVKCKKTFATKTIKSAKWEKFCFECFNERRSTNSIVYMQERSDAKLDAIENRMLKLEEKVNNEISAIIGAEISNYFNYLIEKDVVDSILKKVMDSISDSMQSFVERQIKFEDKIQNQLIVLNNKIISLMKDKGE